VEYRVARGDEVFENQGTVFFETPCKKPAFLMNSPAQITPPSFYYPYDNSVFSITVPPMVPSPGFCFVTYSCALINHVTITELFNCNTAGLTTFNNETISFTLQAGLDRFSRQRPGLYQF